MPADPAADQFLRREIACCLLELAKRLSGTSPPWQSASGTRIGRKARREHYAPQCGTCRGFERDNARGVLRTWEPHERPRGQPLHHSLESLRNGCAPSPRHSRGQRALVHQRDRSHCHGKAANHPRLLRIPPATVRCAVPGTRAAGAGNRDQRRCAPHLGRCRC
jgi:hypothetical protein